MHYITFDLEWNTPITRYRDVRNGVELHGEIVQIGAVKTTTDLEIVDTFSALVKPQVYHKMLKDITALTDITDAMLADARPFTEVLPEFLAWCEGSVGGVRNADQSATYSDSADRGLGSMSLS